MSYAMYSNRTCYINTLNNYIQINPFDVRKSTKITNNILSKKQNGNREFGKEINNESNLTTTNNQEIINNKKTTGVRIEQKIKNLKKDKEELNQRLKHYQQNALRKRKKDISTSLPHSNNKSHTNQSCIIHPKKDNKKKNNVQSQKNIFNPKNTIKEIKIAESNIISDENTNPNIIINKTHENINNNIINKNNNNDDKETKIENNNNKINNININEVIFEIPKNTNPQNVDEYFDDICQELSKYEEKYLVNPEYMSKQSDINSKMRAILIDWLIDVHLKYKLVPQTMYIAVNLIDRFLEKNDIKRSKLQLVGVTAMFIACKYEEIYPPDLKDFVYITDGAYIKSDVLKMENKMLSSLNFDLTFPTQWNLFENFNKKLNLDEKTFKLAWFLIELCLINYNILKYKMSQIAASAILIASKTMNVYKNDWFSTNLGIDEKELDECCKEIYKFNDYNSKHNLKAIRRKFSSTKYEEVAKIKLI